MRTDNKLSSQNNKKVITTNNEAAEVVSSLETRVSQPFITLENTRLLNARETGPILGINPTTVYDLWNRGLMDHWEINGTRRTNLTAIAEFLSRTKNCDLQSEGSKK